MMANMFTTIGPGTASHRIKTALFSNVGEREMILGIDPGNEKSAYVLWDGERVHDKNTVKNESILDLAGIAKSENCAVGIEMISSYGMPVGKEVFETCVWIGRF